MNNNNLSGKIGYKECKNGKNCKHIKGPILPESIYFFRILSNGHRNNECMVCEGKTLRLFNKPYRQSNISKMSHVGIRDTNLTKKYTKQSGFGHIYFVYANEVNKVKIGYTRGNVYIRFNNIQGMSPCNLELLGCIKGTIEDEKTIHIMFEKYRSHNEWFYFHDDIQKFLLRYKVSIKIGT